MQKPHAPASDTLASNRTKQTNTSKHERTHGMALPDLTRYYGSEKLSDVTLVLVEEAVGRHKRARQQEMPCHSMVLLHSTYCSTKVLSMAHAPDASACSSSDCAVWHLLQLENWSTTSSKKGEQQKQVIEMAVPVGQLEIGQLLIRAMYQATPHMADVSQEQLLQLLLLADRYGVLKVQAAVAEAFQQIPLEQLQWGTLLAVYQLPAGCTDLDACTGIYAAAAAKLQQELGDLELVWADRQGSKQQQLQGLPHAALKQLLQDPGTRVASENTVFYTIKQWYLHNTKHSETPTDQQVQELLCLIRMQHCSQLFVGTVLAHSILAPMCFSPGDLAVASIYSSSGVSTDSVAEQQAAIRQAECPLLAKYPAWSAAKRPASAMQELVIDWRVPLQQVKEMVEQHLQDRSDSAEILGEEYTWRGQRVQPLIDCSSSSSSMLPSSRLVLRSRSSRSLMPSSSSSSNGNGGTEGGDCTCKHMDRAAHQSKRPAKVRRS